MLGRILDGVGITLGVLQDDSTIDIRIRRIINLNIRCTSIIRWKETI
jgi:hypothetical protein